MNDKMFGRRVIYGTYGEHYKDGFLKGGEGFFIQFGIMGYKGGSSFTTAIIETDEGKILNLDLNKIKFVDLITKG